MSRRWATLRRAAGGQEGFTILEVLVAILIFALFIGAASGLLIDGEDGSAAAVTNTQLLSAANQQIEAIREDVKTEGFDALAMSSAPVHTATAPMSFDATTQSQPSYFVDPGTGCGVSGVGFDIEDNWDDTTGGAAAGVSPWSGCTNATASPSVVAEPLEVIAPSTANGMRGGFVSATGTTVTVGGQTATVYTYVTDTYLGCANNTTYPSACPTVSAGGVVGGCTWPTAITTSTTCSDARRVIVAVVPTRTGRYTLGRQSPVYVSTIFTAPTPANAPGGTAGLTLGVQLG